MLFGSVGHTKTSSLMNEYASLVSDAVLRQRAQAAEHLARAETELASKVKSEFIANMSHELRTPLNTVIGFSRLLMQHEQRRLTDGEIVEYATLIGDAAAQLLSVINDILDISKLQSGKYALDSQDINVGDVLAGTLSSFEQSLNAGRLKLIASIAADLSPVRGDGAKLRQIFSNIMSNAVKFTPAEGRIDVAAEPASAGIVITIRDSGVGMSAEEIAIAMAPFGQVDGGRSRWREGTGLGLPIARALVELHGGSLSIESAKDAGTRVAIYLPARATAA